MWLKPFFTRVSYISRIRSVGAEGIAIIASSKSELERIEVTLSMGPRTGMPSIVDPMSFLSSSRNAFTFPNIFFRLMSSAIVCPAKPAPII